MTTPETPDVWRECGRRVPLYLFTRLLMLFVASIPLALALRSFAALNWTASFLRAFSTVAFTVYGVLLLKWRRNDLKSRGEIIWDLGPTPLRNHWIIMSYLFAIILSVFLAGYVIDIVQGKQLRIINPFLLFLSVVCSYILATGRLLFCTNGIWAYDTLLTWDMLEYYEWRESEDWMYSALWVKYRRPAVGPLKAILPVPNDSKEEVEKLLRQKCPLIASAAEESTAPEAETHPV